MAEKVPTINLLPHNSENFITQFFNWALSIGRLLIILTETVALATFIYRFSLDAQLVNLHDKINSESIIMDNFQQSETNFRDIQDRLTIAQKYSTIGTRTTGIFNDITNMGKGNVTFKDLTVDTQTAKVEAEAPTSASLTLFVNALRNYPLVSSVSIDKVENDASSAQITVLITATLKSAPFAENEQQTNDELNQAMLNTQ